MILKGMEILLVVVAVQVFTALSRGRHRRHRQPSRYGERKDALAERSGPRFPQTRGLFWWQQELALKK